MLPVAPSFLPSKTPVSVMMLLRRHSNNIISTVLAVLSLFPQQIYSQENCLLCGEPDLPKRFFFLIGEGTKTCLDKYIELGAFGPSSSTCRRQQSLYQVMCCGDAEPPPSDIQPTPAPVYTGGTGSEPDCDICGT